MSSTSVLIATAAGLSASALVALVLGPGREPTAEADRRPEPASARPAGRRRRDRSPRPAEATAPPTATTAVQSTTTATGAASTGAASTATAASAAGVAARRGTLGERMAHSKAVRRSLGALTVVLVVAAGVSMSWPFWTDQYQARLQVRLRDQLEEKIESPAAVEEFEAGQVESGDSLTRLRAPSIGVEVVVVEGTTQEALRAGAGHYPETTLPCGSGNVAIAGHRTTFGKPFNRLDEVQPGDEITLETPLGTCTYKVSTAAFVVTPDDVEVVAPTDNPKLTLTTCHPKGSARERLVLQADLVGTPLLEDRGGRTPPDIRGEA